MMINALVVLAGVLCGPWLHSAQSQLVKATLEDECYNVGSCTPLQEPQGDQSEICKIFEESLACMKSSMEACRKLDFPPETVHQALHGVRLLRDELRTYCSGQQHKKQAGMGHTGALVGEGVDGSNPALHGMMDWEIDGGEIEERETAEHSGQTQSEFNSGSRLPFPAIGATLMISLAVWLIDTGL